MQHKSIKKASRHLFFPCTKAPICIDWAYVIRFDVSGAYKMVGYLENDVIGW